MGVITLVKRFRYGFHIFEPGEIGKVVEVEHPLEWKGKLIYGCYAVFPSFPKAVGVRQEEYKELVLGGKE